MKVREATADDAASILDVLMAFGEEANMGPVKESVGETLLMLYSSPLGGLFVAATDDDEVVGVTGGLLFPMWCNKAHITGQEMFWYVMPDHRRSRAGKLLFNALEDWARESGAHSFHMSSLAGKHQKRVNQIYEKKGYRAQETSFIKEL